MDKKILMLFIFGMFLLVMPLVSAIESKTQLSPEPFKINEEIHLIQICSNETASCDACNITSVKYPNSSTIVSNVEMTKDETEFNYTLAPQSVLGVYGVNGFCITASQKKVWAYNFELTFNGKSFEIQEALIQLGLVAFITFLFILSLFGAFAIEFKNQRNNEGNIFKINWKKYSKITLAFMSYFIFVWDLNLLIELANNYVASSVFFTFLKFLYIFLIGMMLPIFILTLVITIALLLRDIEIKKLLGGGFKVK